MTDHNKPHIWRLQAQFDTRGLIEALRGDDAALRKRAAAALRAMNATDAIPALKAALAEETDEDARQIMTLAVESLGGQTTTEEPASTADVNALLAQLDSSDLDKAISAARKLGDMGNKMAVEPLVVKFANHRLSIHARLAIAEALLKLESAPLEVTLLANLRNTEWQIRRNGAAILGQLKANWAIEPLTRALSDPHPVVRRTARAALKHIGTPEARAALTQADNSTTNAVGRPRSVDDDDKDATIPVAPRNGLLQRIKEKEEQKKKAQAAEQASTSPAPEPVTDDNKPTRPLEFDKHKAPTRPLDPEVVDRAEEQRQSNDD